MQQDCEEAAEWWHGNGSHLMERMFPKLQNQPRAVTKSPILRRILEDIDEERDDTALEVPLLAAVPAARTPLPHLRSESLFYPESLAVDRRV